MISSHHHNIMPRYLDIICSTYPGNEVELICYLFVLCMTLNSSVFVQGTTVKLRPSLRFQAGG